MSRYIRLRREGGLYFFTLVTYKRQPFMTSELSRECLRAAWKETQSLYPFDILAVCLLPDHLHCIWQLPEKDDAYPKRWQKLKSLFSHAYLKSGGQEGQRTARQQKKGERAVFQSRYYEHSIREQDDLKNHFDYIHYNPVKHGLVQSVSAWPWSTFHKYAKMGWYDVDWGLSPDTPDLDLQ